MEYARWSRQILIFENGVKDQEKLLKARITVVGAGGLGSALLMYTVAAGIRNIQLIEHQRVEESNLNRQILYGEGDINTSKALAAKRKLLEIDSQANVEVVEKKVEDSEKEIILFDPDILIDCSDNLEARRFLNRIAHIIKKPFLYAMVEGFSGMLSVVYPYESACFECAFFGKVQKEGTTPILGATAGFAGALEASLAVQIILGKKPLFGELLSIDLNKPSLQTLKVNRRKDCYVCGEG
ncbi:MAG: HesA/MoeB/ThiF family protein [Actinobacteria bacterium]|nr:HesA/MoeB/ThiF family protein [Actinomycetota bacterium]